MSLRLVAVDGELVDRPHRPPATVPDYYSLSRKGRDLLYLLTIGEVPVVEGFCSLSQGQLVREYGWRHDKAKDALQELRDKGFISLAEEARGRRPRVWRVHDGWRADLKMGPRLKALPQSQWAVAAVKGPPSGGQRRGEV